MEPSDLPANVGSNDGLGGSVPKHDASGPPGTYGCACVNRDARNCAILRYGYNPDPDCQRCECLCHGWEDD